MFCLPAETEETGSAGPGVGSSLGGASCTVPGLIQGRQHALQPGTYNLWGGAVSYEPKIWRGASSRGPEIWRGTASCEPEICMIVMATLYL